MGTLVHTDDEGGKIMLKPGSTLDMKNLLEATKDKWSKGRGITLCAQLSKSSCDLVVCIIYYLLPFLASLFMIVFSFLLQAKNDSQPSSNQKKRRSRRRTFRKRCGDLMARLCCCSNRAAAGERGRQPSDRAQEPEGLEMRTFSRRTTTPSFLE